PSRSAVASGSACRAALSSATSRRRLPLRSFIKATRAVTRFQPRGEAPVLLVAQQRFRKPNEHVMHDVLCIFARADEAIGQTEQRRSVLQVESREGVRAPAPCLSDQGRWAPGPGARAHAITRMPLVAKT